MISFTEREFLLLLTGYLYPFMRIGGIFLVDPFYSTRSMPRLVRVAAVFSLTIFIAPLLPAIPEVPIVSAQGLAIALEQFLIGAAIAFTMRTVIAVVEMAGSLISLQMGLNFALFFDPSVQGQVPTLSRFLTTFVYLVFISINGHLLVIKVMLDSFTVLPISLESPPIEIYYLLLEYSSKIFSLGLLLSLPILGSLLIVNLAIGVMTRAAPQFNIFSFGFPMTLAIGFVLIFISIPAFESFIFDLYDQTAEFTLRMIRP